MSQYESNQSPNNSIFLKVAASIICLLLVVVIVLLLTDKDSEDASADSQNDTYESRLDRDDEVVPAIIETPTPTPEPTPQPTPEPTPTPAPIITPTPLPDLVVVPYVEADSYYMISGSDTRYIDDYELNYLTWEQLCFARNEIYARHGYIFNVKEVREHFESMSWYTGTTTSDNFNSSVLNSYEKSNIDTIMDYENSVYGGSYY